jgi:hypothetical protein
MPINALGLLKTHTATPMPARQPTASAPCAFFAASRAPRLGPHHFAYLRACAEGIDVQASARRFLGTQHGHEAQSAHRQTVEAVRAIARRRGESAWRLIGLAIRAQAPGALPSLEDFAAERGLDGWSEDELKQMYAEAYPANPRAARRERLRERQLQLLQRLQQLAAETPLESDLVAGWFDDATATKLITAGMTTLGELQEKIAIGGRWYSALPAVGRAKAARIWAHLATLLPQAMAAPRPVFDLAASVFSRAAPAAGRETSGPHASFSNPSSGPHWPAGGAPQQPLPELSNVRLSATSAQSAPECLEAPGATRPAPGSALLQVSNDAQAVQAWIDARAGSAATARVYQREASRLLLWLRHEAGGKTLRQMTVHDCTAFMAFLQHIPPQWISRARAAPGEQGWAPFRGPLSHQSQKQAVIINASLFAWLQAASLSRRIFPCAFQLPPCLPPPCPLFHWPRWPVA